MGIIYQLDKRSGLTYAYESHAVWDKEKKASKATRKLIGRLDTNTGKIIPTDGRNRKDRVKKEELSEPDYKKLNIKLQQRLDAQESLITALQNEIKKLTSKV